METTLHVRTTVLPGHKIELIAPAMPVGNLVDVTVEIAPAAGGRASVLEILEALPGQSLLKTSRDADEYLKGERDSWER
jgi:hypothetical protein